MQNGTMQYGYIVATPTTGWAQLTNAGLIRSEAVPVSCRAERPSGLNKQFLHQFDEEAEPSRSQHGNDRVEGTE